jgi:hypothetical protein
VLRVLVTANLGELVKLATKRIGRNGLLVERMLRVFEPQQEVEDADVLLGRRGCRGAALRRCSKAQPSERERTARDECPPEKHGPVELSVVPQTLPRSLAAASTSSQ